MAYSLSYKKRQLHILAKEKSQFRELLDNVYVVISFLSDKVIGLKGIICFSLLIIHTFF